MSVFYKGGVCQSPSLIPVRILRGSVGCLEPSEWRRCLWVETTNLSNLLYSLCYRLVLNFDLLVYAFGQFPLVVCTWICMFLSVLVVPYNLFHQWALTQSGSSSHPRLWSLLLGSVFLLYQCVGLGFLPTYVVVSNSMPPASCFIIILEQVAD